MILKPKWAVGLLRATGVDLYDLEQVIVRAWTRKSARAQVANDPFLVYYVRPVHPRVVRRLAHHLRQFRVYDRRLGAKERRP